MHRGLRSGPRMGELFQGQDGSLWRSVGPLEVGAALAGRDEEEVCRWSWDYGSWTDDGRSVPRGPLALVESECTLQVEPSGGERSSASHNSNTFLLFDRKIFRI